MHLPNYWYFSPPYDANLTFTFSILDLFLIFLYTFFFVLAVCWLGLQVSNLTVTGSLFNSKVIFHSLFSSVLTWDTVPINSSYSIVSLTTDAFLQAGFCFFSISAYIPICGNCICGIFSNISPINQILPKFIAHWLHNCSLLKKTPSSFFK